MQVKIVPIGNSKGIRIPKILLKKCGFNNWVKIEILENDLILKPVACPKKSRQNWAKKFAAEAPAELLWGNDFENDFDRNEW